MAVGLSGSGQGYTPNNQPIKTNRPLAASPFLTDLVGKNGFGAKTSLPVTGNSFALDLAGQNAFGSQQGLPVANAARANKAATENDAVMWANQPQNTSRTGGRGGTFGEKIQSYPELTNDPTFQSNWDSMVNKVSGQPAGSNGVLATDASGATSMPDLGKMLADYGDFKYHDFGSSLADYIAKAGDGSQLIASQLAALDQNRQGMKDQAVVGDATIKGMYDELGTKLQSQKQGLADTNATQQANNQASGKQAAANLQNMAAATNSDYADLMKTIGFQIDPNNAAYKGMAENAALNQLVSNDRTQTQANLLQEKATNQANEWSNNIERAGLAGNQQRVNLQNTLQGYLADLASQEAQMRDQAQRDAWNMAKDNYSADWNQYTTGYDNAFRTWDAGRQNQLSLYDAQNQQWQSQQDMLMQQQQMQADQQNAYADQWNKMLPQDRAAELLGSKGFTSETQQTLRGRLQDAINQSGGDPNQVRAILTNSSEKPGEFGYGWSYQQGPQYDALMEALGYYFGDPRVNYPKTN